MSVGEFRRQIQRARNIVYLHLLPHMVADPTVRGQEDADYATLKRSSPIWLTPRTVAGFDPDEFQFLTDEQRRSLSEGVTEFRRIAEAVASREPTHDEVKTGFSYLLRIIGLLDDHILDTEGKALLFALRRSKLHFPDFVLGLDYTLDTDWSGDPGIWIWVIVPDDVDPDSSEFREFSTQFRKEVRRALGEIKSDRLPYVHFRLLSEAIGAAKEEVA